MGGCNCDQGPASQAIGFIIAGVYEETSNPQSSFPKISRKTQAFLKKCTRAYQESLQHATARPLRLYSLSRDRFRDNDSDKKLRDDKENHVI